jgi:GTPase involved in cell partitioning and DNA repair
MLLHLVSLEHEDPIKEYSTILNELNSYHKSLTEKEEWIIFTKKDLVNKEELSKIQKFIDNTKKRVFVISVENGEGVKNLQDSLVEHLRTT